MRFPEQFQILKNDLSIMPKFIDESIRWSTPIKHFMRSAAFDVEVGGQMIRQNDRLLLSYPSANRDPRVFERPDDFSIMRTPNNHLAFGNGPHMCIGQHLAKLDMRILFDALLPRLRSVELAGEPRLLQSNFISGLKSLPIRFKAQ